MKRHVIFVLSILLASCAPQFKEARWQQLPAVNIPVEKGWDIVTLEILQHFNGFQEIDLEKGVLQSNVKVVDKCWAGILNGWMVPCEKNYAAAQIITRDPFKVRIAVIRQKANSWYNYRTWTIVGNDEELEGIINKNIMQAFQLEINKLSKAKLSVLKSHSIEMQKIKLANNGDINKCEDDMSLKNTLKDNTNIEETQTSAKLSEQEPSKNIIKDSQSSIFGNYYALFIANNNYMHLAKLQTPISDVEEIASILKKNYCFNIELLLDASRADILLTFGKLREKLSKKDNLLIYYAGHGWLDKKGDEGYWLPVDASQDNEVNWISNASITTALKAMEAKHILIIADSCYSGKLARSIHVRKKGSDYYLRLSEKRARSVISSGGLEPVIDSGGKGNHSVFASAFLEALKGNTDIIDATEMFSRIRRPIMLNSDQSPEYSDIRKAGHDGGEFIFVRVKK